MQENIYVIGDVHGCYKTLLALIDKFPNGLNSRICFVGDVIDRGENSAEVIELILQNGYDCVLGNHEFRLLKFSDEFLKGKELLNEPWFYKNGGAQTFASYQNKQKLKEKHLKFMRSLPVYIEYKNLKTSDQRKLVVSHSAVGKMWNSRKDKSLKDDFRKHVISGRDDTFENAKIFNVYGHTPLKDPDITNFSANIDLGCVYKQGANPRLCAIEFPSMKIFTQENIES
ncbi:metallophosphoesterase [Campylobacter sp. RM9344]|uniref:Metallophosphoesterase n=1 Tax=Campylobacter californiensis TaxID=1032243 RepID=A0AAW3ZWJ3_9BACT|nr:MULTISPECIES: metallophosphoesterase [unclassified Campylobacter]MBE2985515.1 metallophosphoesterase [Campylobacter sp. RM6883]MBE2987279.1 metallophosphoesterase [Campylobacter sp. RM12919]MBE2989050.1 metallophosphoesterase [Campylobacter sp. RM12920]MBE2996048.1 metallophosphoesterase [Campylobacter sp. RM6913]MBE3030363.1 metallophosphoesterase [Campylobacter sp. RM9344]